MVKWFLLERAVVIALLHQYSLWLRIDPAITVAIAEVESNFNPRAIGDQGQSYGVMQLHLQGAGAGHDPHELLNFQTNIELGVNYLQRCLAAAGYLLDDAVSAYNQGISGWQMRGRSVNQGYVDKVMERYSHYTANPPERLVAEYVVEALLGD